MATKKNPGGEGVSDVSEVPAASKVTYQSIAVDLLDALVANGHRESPMHGLVVGALERVRQLAHEAEAV